MAEQNRNCKSCGKSFLATNGGWGPLPKWCETCRVGAIRQCAFCGSAFEIKTAGQAACSRACSRRARIGREETLSCLRCAIQFEKRSRAGDKNLYCSRECAFKYKADRSIFESSSVWFKKCNVCERPFVARRSNVQRCGEDCDKIRHRQKERERSSERKDLTPRDCRKCGKPFTPIYGKKNRVFCSKKCLDASFRPPGRTHRIRARRAGVAYEPIDKEKLFIRDNWTCQICGVKCIQWPGKPHPRAATLDHVVAIANGGGHLWGNVQCACWKCNIDKGSGEAAGQVPMFAQPPT